MKCIENALPLCLASTCLLGAASGATVSFDLSKTGSIVNPRHMTGTCLPFWNDSGTYRDIKKGLSLSHYRLFRFPNGSLSNGYHWNGSGAYTSEGAWVSDYDAYKPGFMSMTRYRGTSVYSYGFSGCSNITDGDTATFWRSGEVSDTPYFYLELPRSSSVDSIVILWGKRYPVDFDVDFFSSPDCPYPGPFKYPDNFWLNQKRVRGNDQTVFSSALPSNGPKYIRVTISAFKNGEKSVEVKEAYLYYQGKQVTVNAKKYSGSGAAGDQTRVIAMPTFEGNDVRPDYAAGWVNWDFETFIGYIHSISDSAMPVICVNYGTGTPQEAVAWVYWANIKKKYNITFWQIGNEMDGEWEEGGPVNARMYAEKYLRFAAAMKAVDSTIKILGPVLSNADFNVKNSGVYDGKPWLQSFLAFVGARETSDGKKYCDGVDFHSYPYYSTSPVAAELMSKIDYVYDQSDSLPVWINKSLVNPDSVFVMMSEYNSSVVMSDLLQRPSNGIFAATMFAGLAAKFCDRAMSVFWDSYEGGDIGPAGTFGSLSLFNDPGTTVWSSFSKAPSAAYWALFAAQNLWIDPDKENTLVPAAFSKSDSLRAYGDKTGNDFRALIVNVSFGPETLSCVLSGGGYDSADVFTWGEKQFAWTGTGRNAFAFPNCGPVSYCAAVKDLSGIVVPAQSLCVARYRNAAGAAEKPTIIHLAAHYGSGPWLVVCGSAYGTNNAVTSIDYSIDPLSSASHPLRSLDAGYDGPFESFLDSIPFAGLTAGSHVVYVRARTAGGLTALDSFSFAITTAAKQTPLSSQNHGPITMKRWKNRITLFVTAPAAGAVRAQVFSLSGKLIGELARSEKDNRAVLEWNGNDAAGAKVGGGVYLLVITSSGKVIYKKPLLVAR